LNFAKPILIYMPQKHTFEIQEVINSSKPENEFVILAAKGDFNTKGFALVDRTFDEEGRLSNEFRHTYVFPEVQLKAGERIVVCTGEGEDGPKNLPNGTKFHALYWGAKDCVWNDKGGDTATLISFAVVNSKVVPPVKKKA
jgi:hypothetical protein